MNGEVEQSIIAALLKHPKNIDSLDANSDWFMIGNYQIIFEAIQQADSESLMTIYGKARYLSNQMTMSFQDLVKLRDSSVTDANLPELVRDLHRLKIQSDLQQAIRQYHDAPFADNLVNLTTLANNLANLDVANDNGRIDDQLKELTYNLDHPTETGIKSYPQLDKCLAGGFYGGMLFTLGARPGVGKTAYSVNLAAKMLAENPDLHVDYFTLEMTKREMVNRFIANRTGVPSTTLRSSASTLTPTLKQVVVQAVRQLGKLDLAIYDQTKTLGQITSVIRRNASAAKKNCYVAFVDYIGLITVPAMKERYLQVGEITRELKVMANEYDVPIVALTQLNRGIENRQDREPQLSDIRESGSVEQDSNVVAFLSRDKAVKDVTNLLVKKNREGWQATIPYQFNGRTMKFQELDVSADG